MDLTISIVNYATPELTIRCVQSIQAHPPTASYEIVVVDNASPDGSVARLTAACPGIRVIASPTNRGYAGGNNLALEATDSNAVLIMNSDMEVHPGALDALLEFLAARPQAGLAGGRLVLPTGEIQPVAGRLPSLPRFAGQQLGLDRLKAWRTVFEPDREELRRATQPVQVERLEGACMMCRRAALAQVGGMDEGYWMYCEDDDLCRRIAAAGWELWYLPAATLLHLHGASSRTARATTIAAYNCAMVRYCRIHHTCAHAAVARALGLLGCILRLTLWSLLFLVRREQRSGLQVRLFREALGRTWGCGVGEGRP